MSETSIQLSMPGLAPADCPASPPPSLIFRPASYVEWLDPAAVFPVAQPLEVELGSGDGSFLAQYAQIHPERNFLGVERLMGRLRKLDRKGRRAGLSNLRLLRIEAGYCLEFLLPAASVAALHLYFPDPWPKRRHHRRRLVNTRFMELAHRALTAGGHLFLRTDDADYFAQMTSGADAHPCLRAVDTPADLRAIPTDFEKEFLARGLSVNYAAYQKQTIA